jgi:hypothetical protein
MTAHLIVLGESSQTKCIPFCLRDDGVPMKSNFMGLGERGYSPLMQNKGIDF